MNFKIIILILTLITLISKVTYGQDCDCKNNFEWVKKTFEENDAGFQYILDKKGQQAYNIHNTLFADKIKSAKSLTECTTLLYEWLTFFRSGHIGIEPLRKPEINEKPIVKTESDNVKSTSANEPYLEEINGTTLLLRIPSFEQSQKAVIDNVILTNKEKILKTENLIIDLRNNGGGSDNCFSELIPFLYTNPIRTIGVEFLSTKLNNQRMLDFATNPEYGLDEDTKKWAKDSYDKLEEYLNEFVSLNSVEVSVKKQDTIYRSEERRVGKECRSRWSPYH